MPFEVSTAAAPWAASHTRPRDDIPASRESSFWLEGIHCAACAGLIEAAARGVSGVEGVKVSATLSRAQVRWNPASTDLSAIIQAVRAAGYRAIPVEGALEDAANRRTRERKRLLWQLFVAWFCAMQVMMLATPSYVAGPTEISPDLSRLMNWGQWLLCLPVMLFSARPFLQQAWAALRYRRIVMEVPVAIGLLVMFVASMVVAFAPDGAWGHEVVFDSLSMFVAILLTGRWVEMRLRHQAAQALEQLLSSSPQRVQRVCESGEAMTVDAADLKVGDRIRVAAGERFAADAVILRGRTQVSESMMTGESTPVLKEAGQTVWSGSVNQGLPVEVCVTALGADTRWSQLVSLADRAAMERPPLVQMADRWAGPFLWSVMAMALLAAFFWWWVDPSRAVWVAVAVLVVTCPCALSLAAPAALTAAARAFAREGVLLQRLSAIEDLAQVDLMVFDKTGTLTLDRLHLIDVQDLGASDTTHVATLAKAASLASWSRHPASVALVEAAQGVGEVATEWSQIQERPGLGLEAVDEQGTRWRLGRSDWVRGVSVGPARPASDEYLRHVGLAFGPVGCPIAEFEFQDTVRHDAAVAVKELRRLGVLGSVLSGDAPQRVAAVAAPLGLPVLQSGALPQDKQALVKALQAQGHVVAMVGDGINDAPVLGQSQVSLAMGEGAGATLARADLVISPPRLDVLPRLVQRARITHAVIRQNLLWALVYNFSAIPLALMGYLPPWAAGLGMTVSSLLVALNSRRAGHSIRATAP